MTQVKNNDKKVKDSLDIKAKTKVTETGINLRQMYFGLKPNEQQAVTNFFALHNAATWIYDNLEKDSKKYVDTCIKLSREQVNDGLK